MLYTRKGDNGTTKLYACDGRMRKDEPRVEALGSLDELNSYVGLCRVLVQEKRDSDVAAALLDIQQDLFVLQAMLAGAPKELSPTRVDALEAMIARAEKEIPPITSFTVSGATVCSGALDVARTIARRTERRVVALRGDELSGAVQYLNRLSSVLFAFARLAAHRVGAKEEAPHY